MQKTDAQVVGNINKTITRIDNSISQLLNTVSQRIDLKEWEIQGLKREILYLVDGIAKVYNHNEAAKAAVIEHIGRLHRPKVRKIIKERSDN